MIVFVVLGVMFTIGLPAIIIYTTDVWRPVSWIISRINPTDRANRAYARRRNGQAAFYGTARASLGDGPHLNDDLGWLNTQVRLSAEALDVPDPVVSEEWTDETPRVSPDVTTPDYGPSEPDDQSAIMGAPY